uniref:Mannosyltransferase n=1 Tax=Hirondellea gigas TaxID=1518452 RepID=A0A2P2I866_9CRUS
MAGQSRGRHRTNVQQQAARKETLPTPKNINKSTKSSTVEITSISSSSRVWAPGTYTALKVLMSARFISAIFGIISDCDETYNYWEPSHYLLYGSGFQTWEYSPQFALRSYFYLMLHAAPAWLYDAIISNKRVMVFFFMKCLLGALSSACDIYFYRGVVLVYGGCVGRITLCLLVFSAGLFAAANAFLPSSFAMYAVSCGIGAWLHRKYKLTILCFAVASFIAWPFAALIGVPIAYDIVVRKGNLTLFVKWSLISTIIIMGPMITVDSSYYGRLVVAPANLLLYNLFTSHGPNLYGTEPWTYYFVNGFLNFNVAFLLALAALPIYVASRAITGATRSAYFPVSLVLSPLYLWLLVFVVQPHKEERFLFPVYPLICLAAAIAIDSIEKAVALFPWRAVGQKACWLTVLLLALSSTISVSRIIAQYRGYSAPMHVFMELLKIEDPSLGNESAAKTRVCLGKEWHRFPSSFFLPGDRWEVQFIKSEFKGQLPQHFLNTIDGPSVLHDNFNDLNQEETDRYVKPQSCHYLVDMDSPNAGGLEPQYSAQTDKWKTVISFPFLDAARSPRWLRAFYVPFYTERHCAYNSYNLLQNIALVKQTT